MHQDILHALSHLNPDCLHDPTTQAALRDWHHDIRARLTAKRHGVAWLPSRDHQQGDAWLAELVAAIIADLSRTAQQHSNICLDPDAVPLSQATTETAPALETADVLHNEVNVATTPTTTPNGAERADDEHTL